ncbi:MAG: SCO family protein [Bryobacteraceae bacterium]|nr:SCO family protein [Bryobacteraceae bacterium]MDW8380255.1 SCO family protein [Bryobacterales bacterium]
MAFTQRAWVLVLAAAGLLSAQSSKLNPGSQMEMLKQVAFEQKLNTQLPLELVFRDEEGRSVALKQFFHKKPVILAPVYYECPMLCDLTMSGLVKALRTLRLDAGKDFDVIMLSFNPRETPVVAADKKKAYLKRYNRPGTEHGWHFLTGDEPQIRALTEAMGFRYVYDPTTKQYAHAAGIVIATPEGRLSRYIFGMDPSARDVRLGLVESAQGRVGDPVAQLLLMCFHYDPAGGKYTLNVLTAVRLAGALTVALMGGFLIVNLRRERRQRVG